MFPECDLTEPIEAERGYRVLPRLRQYDAILTPSLTTRGDVVALLGLPPERVFAIGNAADGLGFRPEEFAADAPGGARRASWPGHSPRLLARRRGLPWSEDR